MASGAITETDIRGGDLHDLVQGRAGRGSAEEITVFKNGGGAHLERDDRALCGPSGARGTVREHWTAESARPV